MAQKLAIYFLSSIIISGTCMMIQRAPIPVLIQYRDDPNYTFSYDVNDPQTGDIKSQQETRRGDKVTGQYSLIQPDGIQRTVDYHADDLQGFLATVNNERLETSQPPKDGVGATNNRQTNEDQPCQDCSIDLRVSSDALRHSTRANGKVPIQWQVDYTNIHNEPRAVPKQENSKTPREKNDNRPIQKFVENEQNEFQNLPIATSRTSIIQRIDNNQPVVVATIPWV